MAGATKMIIITSDEDLIRKFSLKQTTTTQIIDLGEDAELASLVQTNDIINIPLLTQLSTLNSKSDQVYKRALDSPHHHRTKSAKHSKKSSDLLCAICGDRAIGFNYDVLSCASCKAFFRRNAHQSRDKLRCLTGDGRCSVAHETRRKCPRCRLDRCLGAGMRKDFILSEEEKQRRRERLEENRNATLKPASAETLDEIDQLFKDMERDGDHILLDEDFAADEIEGILCDVLSVEDRRTIDHLRTTFSSVFPRHDNRGHSIDASDHTSALLAWSEFASGIARNYINFFRHVDEFEGLNNDDRFVLIKYNLLPLFSISKCYSYQPGNDCCSSDNNALANNRRRFFMLCGDSQGVQDTFVQLILSLVDITKQDPAFLSLLLAMLIFTRGLSMNEDEPLLKDPLAVHRAQNHYTKLLWNYLIDQWGEAQAHRYFARLMTVIMRTQSAVKVFRDFICAQFTKTNIVDRMAPLMQSVLNIS